MGIQNSKNQYSFNDHYYIIQDSFPSDNYYRLQSKLTDQLFIGRQINCIDKQDSYQTQCIINEKLKNPSPFVTKLLSAQKNSINSYCETNQKYYLLYRQVSKLLSNQIEERKIKNIGFTGQQIIMVIIRICKGLKYIYQIGHFHNNVTANTISWPTQNHQSIQLIDQWSLRDSNRTLQNNIQATQNNNNSNVNNTNNNNMNMDNKYTDNLYQLGLVAKSMLQISKNTNKNQQLWQSINHKIFVLCSQNSIDRLQIYQIFNNRDRELENKIIHTTNTNTNINNNINTVNIGNNVNNMNNINNMNMNKGDIDNRNNINVNYHNNGIQYTNINNQINNKLLVGKSTAPLPNQIISTNTNQYQYQQYSNNINQNNQYNNKFITNLNNVNYTQPANVNTSLSSFPTNINNKQQPLNINFNNNKVTTTSTLTNNYSSIPNPINLNKNINNNVYNIPPPPTSSTTNLSINGIKTATNNNTSYQIYKQQFHKISTSSNKPSQHFYQPTPIIIPDVQQNFLNIAGPQTNTSTHGLSSLNNSSPVITPFTIPSINTSSISAYPATTITNPTLTTNTYQYQTTNTSNTLNSFVNNSNNFSPAFGNQSSTVTSGAQNSSSLFSFKDSLNGSSKIGGGSDDNLFTSPDFFSKIHGSQMKFNNIKIQDHQTNSVNVNNLYSNNNNSSLLSNNKVITNLNPQQQYTSNINNVDNNQQYHPQVTSSLTNNFTAVQVNHVNQKQSPNQPAVITSLQIQQPKNINLAANNINNNSHTISNQNPQININISNPQPVINTNLTSTNPTSTISNTFSSTYTSTTSNLRPPHVSVIPQLTQQSDNQDQQHQYVVQQYQNGSRYEGQKFDGMRDGNGKFYYKQGSYYDGKWKKNNMHGFGKLYYPNHKLAYQGDWFIDQFHGYGKVYNDQPTPINSCFDYTNFERIQQKWKYYQGTLVCDSKQGFGKLVLSNGQYYEGNFQGDRVHGQGKFVNMFGEIVHGIWQDSKLVKVLDI